MNPPNAYRGEKRERERERERKRERERGSDSDISSTWSGHNLFMYFIILDLPRPSPQPKYPRHGPIDDPAFNTYIDRSLAARLGQELRWEEERERET